MRLRSLLSVLVVSAIVWPAGAASISKKYTYFSIYGNSAEDLDKEIAKRGPKLPVSGSRHPGATSMSFGLKTKISNDGAWCRLERAFVTLDLKLTLPKWKNRGRASGDMALMWDTLSSDIKRHEERHGLIARNYAIELERTLESLPRDRDCKRLQVTAEAAADRILAAHAKAQADFDKVESINFEARLARLLEYRVEQSLKR